MAGQQDLRPLSCHVGPHMTENTESFSSSKWLDERYSILEYFPSYGNEGVCNGIIKASLWAHFPVKEKYCNISSVMGDHTTALI